MSKKEIEEFTNKINVAYKNKTGNRLILREFDSKWYLCEMVPLGENTLTSGSLEYCMDYMRKLIA